MGMFRITMSDIQDGIGQVAKKLTVYSKQADTKNEGLQRMVNGGMELIAAGIAAVTGAVSFMPPEGRDEARKNILDAISQKFDLELSEFLKIYEEHRSST